MTRIRITTTNNTSIPKTVWLGSGIKWYAYVRPPNQTLCIQRSQNDVLDVEVEITTPVPHFDVIKDPATPDVGWIYFVHDGATERLMVTPLAATLNSVAYTRQNGWYQSVPAVSGGTGLVRSFTAVGQPPIKTFRVDNILEGTKGTGGTGLVGSWSVSEGPDPPVITIEQTTIDLRLKITLPNLALYRNRNVTELRVYRNQYPLVGFEYYSTVVVPPQPETWEPPLPTFSTVIPATGTPKTLWYIACVRTGYLASESRPSNTVFDDGDLPTIYVEQPVAVGGTGVVGRFSTVEVLPNKALVSDPPTETIGEQYGFGGSGLSRSWTVNGTNIINP